MTLALDLPPQPDSPLRARDPRWKLAAVTFAIAMAAALQSLTAAALACLGAWALIVYGRVPVRWVGARLAPLAPFLGLLVVLLPIFDSAPPVHIGPLAFSAGLRAALVIVLKATAVVSFVCVLLTAAPLPVTLHAARALHMPGLFVQLGLLTYRYVFLLADEWGRMRIALRVRGYRNRASLHCYRTVAYAAGTLLVRGHERAERVAQAMQCRAFDGRFRSLTEFRTTPADVIVLVGVFVAGGLLLAADLWRWFPV